MKPLRSRLRPLLLIVLAATVPVATASAQDAAGAEGSMATIESIRFHVEPNQTRVWLETTGAVLYTHYSPDPLTLVIDLPGVDVSALPERTVVGSREVESVLVKRLDGVNGKRLSRIEIQLASIAPYQISGTEQALNITFDGSDAAESPDASTSPEDLVATADDPLDTERESDIMPEPAPEIRPEIREERITPPASGPPASAIRGISHERLGDGLKVRVSADGRLDYTSFTLEGPKRLVFDFNGVLNEVPRKAIDIEEFGVSRVRVAQFRSAEPRITRVVFDLDGEVVHRALDRDGGLEILFAPSEENLAKVTPAFAAIEADAGPDSEQVLDAGDPEENETDEPGVTTLTANADGAYLVRGAALTSEDGGAYQPVTLTAQDLSLADPAPPAAPALPAPPPQEPDAGQDTPQRLLLSGGELGTTQYTGELISLDFKDGDIQDIFRLFADISGLNIVVQPGVTGRITLKLTEVPWDQALELILKTNKLGYIVEGNVIRIAPLAELAEEEAEKRRLAEEKALAGELFTQTRVLSYAKASEIMPLLQRNLSARGDIVIDERTNTVIFTDLAAGVAAVNNLIDTLDTPIPGVEIESRIVVTSRNFERQLGIQWGFTSSQTQALGNTTELSFPNRVEVDGQAIGSDALTGFRAPPAEGGVQSPNRQVEGSSVQRGYAVNLPFAGTPTGAIGLSLGSITGAFSIDAAISAAERRGHVRVISAPKIITQNNKAAEIKQGVTFPVQVVANNTITVQFKDAVLDLSVTPQITSADTIILDIEINNDIADFSNPVNGIPSIRTQAATTQVLVSDGSTTVIGGVFVNTQTTSETYVPLLHKIPILGYLFKAREDQNENRELLIFLTPRIRKDAV